jgi:hypothetical protein
VHKVEMRTKESGESEEELVVSNLRPFTLKVGVHDANDVPILDCSLPLRATLLYENGAPVKQVQGRLCLGMGVGREGEGREGQGVGERRTVGATALGLVTATPSARHLHLTPPLAKASPAGLLSAPPRQLPASDKPV